MDAVQLADPILVDELEGEVPVLDAGRAERGDDRGLEVGGDVELEAQPESSAPPPRLGPRSAYSP